MLIFSMQGSGSFQGVASLVGSHPSDTCSELAGPNLGSPLPVKWLKYGDIPFQATRHLMNPYNEGRNVQTSRDGQVIKLIFHVCVFICNQLCCNVCSLFIVGAGT